MHSFRVIIGLFILLASQFVSAQTDTVRLRQRKSRLFSNHYYFYPNQTFDHYFSTDDGQEWHGAGHYIVKRNRYTLYFENILEEKAIVDIVPVPKTDFTIIKTFDKTTKEESVSWMELGLKNERDNKWLKSTDIFHEGDTTAKIPNEMFKDITLLHIPISMYQEVNVKIDSSLIASGVEIDIYLVRNYQNISPKTEIMKKRGKYWKMREIYGTVRKKYVQLERF